MQCRGRRSSRRWLLVGLTVYPSDWTRNHNVSVMLLPSLSFAMDLVDIILYVYDERKLITGPLANRNLNTSWTPRSILTVVPRVYFYYFCSLSPSFLASCVNQSSYQRHPPDTVALKCIIINEQCNLTVLSFILVIGQLQDGGTSRRGNRRAKRFPSPHSNQ